MGKIPVEEKEVIRKFKLLGRTYQVTLTQSQLDNLSRGLKVVVTIAVVGAGVTGVVLYKKRDEVKAKIQGVKEKFKKKLEARKHGY